MQRDKLCVDFESRETTIEIINGVRVAIKEQKELPLTFVKNIILKWLTDYCISKGYDVENIILKSNLFDYNCQKCFMVKAKLTKDENALLVNYVVDIYNQHINLRNEEINRMKMLLKRISRMRKIEKVRKVAKGE